MKQKIVIKLSMQGDKCRSKALKVIVKTHGVESVSLTGDDKDKVEVVGVEIDSVELTRRLRKKVAPAELVSVGEAKKEEKKPDLPVVGFWAPPYYSSPYYNYWEARDPCYGPSCTIM